MLKNLFTLKEGCENFWLNYNGAQKTDLLAILHFQAHAMLYCLTLRVMAPQYFEIAVTTQPTTQGQIPGDFSFQQ